MDPNQKIKVHTLVPSTKCDFERLVIQFHDVLAQDSILIRKSGKNRVKIPESTLSQKVKLNYQVEIKNHIHAQVQFQKRNNMSKCQCDSQIFNFGQV